MRTVLNIAVIVAVVLAGCGTPWIRPDDPKSIEMAEDDVRAALDVVVYTALSEREASRSDALDLANALGATKHMVEDGAPESAVDLIFDQIDVEDAVLYERIVKRAVARVRARMQTLDLDSTDRQVMEITERLVIAALDGAETAARDYAEDRRANE